MFGSAPPTSHPFPSPKGVQEALGVRGSRVRSTHDSQPVEGLTFAKGGLDDLTVKVTVYRCGGGKIYMTIFTMLTFLKFTIQGY